MRVKYEYDKNYSSMPIMGTVPVAGGTNATKIVDYVGNRIYETIGTENSKLKRILIDGGYIEGNKYYFYLSDHLGNNRVVVDNLNKSIQNTHYYPFGMPFADSNNPDKQPYKYNNKELDSELGLDSYDYVARMLGMDVPRFYSMDPLAEKYYSWSPYMYCYNNPMKFIDPDGKQIKLPPMSMQRGLNVTAIRQQTGYQGDTFGQQVGDALYRSMPAAVGATVGGGVAAVVGIDVRVSGVYTVNNNLKVPHQNI